MRSEYDVIALGELLIDFACKETDADGYPVMAAHPGGAPANFLAALTRFGAKTSMIGKVGADTFGKLLLGTLEKAGIGTEGMIEAPDVFTTLAFVTFDPDGDRHFAFARKPGADTCLRKDEISTELLDRTRVLHFGTLSLTDEPARSATQFAVAYAKEHGKLITFDPNLRPPLWKSLEDARREIEYGLTKCDVLKISDNEVEFLFDTTDYDKGAALIEEKYHIPLVLITLGKDGSRAYYKGRRVECAPFLQEHTIETTGAGDTFCASILNYVLDHGLEDLSDENLMEMLTFANAGASLITTRKGALRVMPTREEVEEFIAKSGR